MLTAGIDLAAEPKGTALAVIEWPDGADPGITGARATVVDLRVGVTDDAIVAVAPDLTSLGIDCAFGWPDDFLRFITAHAAGERVDRSIDEGMAWRRRLAYRETDRDIRLRTGRWPLSVATDRLGLTAMHCAALLDRLGEAIGPINRAGSGIAAEVYPSATLRTWGFDTRGYKNDPARRVELLAQLEGVAPWLDLHNVGAMMIESDDAFDAVIAALGARAHALGVTFPAPPELLEQARREGWIHLPTVPLEDLRPH